MQVTEAIAEILKAEGVKFIIGYPVNPIIEAAAIADIRTIIVRQERIGLHMADAVSRLSSGDDIGVFVMQHGPGAENAFGGVAQAFSESVPLLVMPAGYQRRLAHYYPNFNSTLNMQHITKSAEPVTMGKALPEVMRRAFWQLRNGRGGPVLVEVPLDVFREEVGDFTYVPSFKARSGPDPEAVHDIAKILASAKNPVIYAGQGVHYAKAWDELKQLAETWQIPVTTSLEGKSAFPENHPLALGSGGRAIPRAVHEYLKDADVIFGIGCSFALTAFGVQMPKGKTIIHATLDPKDLNKDVPAQHVLLGDAKLTLAALNTALAEQPKDQIAARSSVAQSIADIKQAWLAEWMPKLTANTAPISPYRVIWELKQLVDPENTVITHDAGSPRDQLSPFWESTRPLSYIGWGKTTQLGYGLGLAMGAKLARPEALCINVWGDAAIGFTGMDFETAVRERIPILSILFNNFSMAIELPIMPVSTEKYRSTDISGHYADMAKAFGGYGERVTDPNEIVAALQRGIEATEAGQPALLEFITGQELAISTF
ncbi:MAG: thiamine pyrophosphate-requiring protein [Pseudomonadales bacterium]|jgi:thiamine pyrophosphate-dependent acetolactate synthase large subunit-like protein|tara:strand:- start:588 stop:2216 length:1629 start_codon:yes stop_codon:yes gene_type:complete